MIEYDELLKHALSEKASDLHISVGVPPCMRIDGKIKQMTGENCSPSFTKHIVESITNEKQLTLLNKQGELDFAYSIPQIGRFRVNAFLQRGSYAIVARISNVEIPSAESLGIPTSVIKMTDKRRGLVLVTGPTGSGKSTTLASLIDIINTKYSHHIITLEDPIEYLHRHKKSIVNQREIGSDSKSFAASLKSSLRQDPDVILVGEMRDLETISTAITAAETGHLVFSTLHTIGTANTVDRIIDVFPPHQQQQIRMQLADVLECVVSQQLLPKSNGKGRVAAMEVMTLNPAIKNHIRESKTYQIPTVIQTNRQNGMIMMDDAIIDLYMAGKISREIALSYAQDSKTMQRKLP